MKKQRAMLAEKFRAEVLDDDITKKLVVHKDKELDEVFSIELKKHEASKKVIQQNLAAQANILQALTEINARYVGTRKIVTEIVNARNEMVGSLVASFYAHEDLLHKAAKGLEFYDKLDSNVYKLLSRVKSVAKVQQQERDAVLAKNVPSKDDFLPGAPPLPASYDPMPPPPPSGKPTLKDYLKVMKETNSDASAAYAALRGGEGPRPPPVGSEDEQTPHMHSALPNWQSGTPASSHPGQAASPAVPSPAPSPSPVKQQVPYPGTQQPSGFGQQNHPYPYQQAVRPAYWNPSFQQIPQEQPRVSTPQQLPQPSVMRPMVSKVPGQTPQDQKQPLYQPLGPSTSVPVSQHHQPKDIASLPNQGQQQSVPQVPASQHHQPQVGLAQPNQVSQAYGQPLHAGQQQPQLTQGQQQSLAQVPVSQHHQPQVGLAQPNQVSQAYGQPLHAGQQQPQLTQGQQQSLAQVPVSQHHQPQVGLAQPNQVSQASGQPLHAGQQQPQLTQGQQQSLAQVPVSQHHQPQVGLAQPNQVSQASGQPLYAGQQQPQLNQGQQQSLAQVPVSQHHQPQVGLAQSNQVSQVSGQPHNAGQQQHQWNQGQQQSLAQVPVSQHVGLAPINQQMPGQPHVAQGQQNVPQQHQVTQAEYGQQRQLYGVASTAPNQTPSVQTPTTQQTMSGYPQHGQQRQAYPAQSQVSAVQVAVSRQPHPHMAQAAVNQVQTPYGQPQHSHMGSLQVTSGEQTQRPQPTTMQPQYNQAYVAPTTLSQSGQVPFGHQSMPGFQVGQQHQPQVSTPNQVHQPGQLPYASGQHRPAVIIPTQHPQAMTPGQQRPATTSQVSQVTTQPLYGQQQQPYLTQAQQSLAQVSSSQPQQSGSTCVSQAAVQAPYGQHQPQGVQYPTGVQNRPPNPQGYPNQHQNPHSPYQYPGGQQLPPGPHQSPAVRQPPPTPQNQYQGYQAQQQTGQIPVASPVVQVPSPRQPQPVQNQSEWQPEIKLRPVVPQPGTSQVDPEPPTLARRTSLDDMLDEIDDDHASVVLVPKVMTASELAEQKKQAKALNEIAQASTQDPYEDKQTLDKLMRDMDKLSKSFEDDKFFNEKWKRINALWMDTKLNVSVARCYPMKNRSSEVLPFDSSRVEMPTTKDDYINASHIQHLSTHSPRFIATQWPTANTFNDFWIMVWQERVETMVTLIPDPPSQQVIQVLNLPWDCFPE